MELTRREAMGLAAAFAAFSAEVGPRALAQALTNAPSNAVDVDDYWSNFYDSHLGKGTKGGGSDLPDPDRQTKYLWAAESGHQPVYADTIPSDTLPALDGDLLVKIGVSQYRPGHGDISTDVSHLRIDAAQPFDMMNVIAPMAWAAIASITPDKSTSKIPSIDQLGLKASTQQPTGITQVTLPGGIGNLGVNVSRPTSTLVSELFSAASVSLSAVLSILNVPAISGPAASAFTKLLGKWQSHATIIMNGHLTPVIATSKPAQAPLNGTPMPLPSGYFVMVPKKHQVELNDEIGNLQMLNGFLVSKDPNDSGEIAERAGRVIRGVSYVTLRMYVTKAPAAACGAKVDSPPFTT